MLEQCLDGSRKVELSWKALRNIYRNFILFVQKYISISIQARKDNRRLIRVSMLISVRGIKMSDLETGKTLLNFSIYR